MIASLDAMANERPQMLTSKKRHFNVADKHGTRKEVSLEWMRLNAERDRLSKLKDVVSQSAIVYYSLLEEYQKFFESYKAKQAALLEVLIARGVEIDMPIMMEQSKREK